MTADWQIHPREADLSRLYDPLSGWSKLTLVERHNLPDTWSVTGPPEALEIFGPGSGSIIDTDGEQVTSGSVIDIDRGASWVDDRLVETTTVTFAEDSEPLGGRIIYPTPTHVLTAAISNFPDAYDLRSGAVEDLIIGYIRSHAGDLAQAGRAIPRLRVPVSLGRGGTTQVSGRLDYLGILVRDLAEAGNLSYRVNHVEDPDGSAWLDLVIDSVRDLSTDVRFGTSESANAGLIGEWNYKISKPTTTRAIVAGGGELTARDFLQIASTDAETLWNTRVERLIDQRQVDPTSADKLAELTRAGDEGIEEGAGPVKVSFEPILGPDLRYRQDVRVGDIVGYDLPGLDPAEDKIREATTVVTVEEGQPTEKVTVVVGSPDAPLTRSQQQTARALRAITVIQRSQ